MTGRDSDHPSVIRVTGRGTHIRFHIHHLSVSTRATMAVGTSHWIPPVDLYETERELVLEVNLAGVTSDEVNVQFTGRAVQLTGSRPDAAESGPKSYHVMEIERGRFSRTIDLPVAVEPGSVRASYSDGLLIIHAAKRSTIRGCTRSRTREGLE